MFLIDHYLENYCLQGVKGSDIERHFNKDAHYENHKTNQP